MLESPTWQARGPCRPSPLSPCALGLPRSPLYLLAGWPPLQHPQRCLRRPECQVREQDPRGTGSWLAPPGPAQKPQPGAGRRQGTAQPCLGRAGACPPKAPACTLGEAWGPEPEPHGGGAHPALDTGSAPVRGARGGPACGVCSRAASKGACAGQNGGATWPETWGLTGTERLKMKTWRRPNRTRKSRDPAWWEPASRGGWCRSRPRADPALRGLSPRERSRPWEAVGKQSHSSAHSWSGPGGLPGAALPALPAPAAALVLQPRQDDAHRGRAADAGLGRRGAQAAASEATVSSPSRSPTTWLALRAAWGRGLAPGPQRVGVRVPIPPLVRLGRDILLLSRRSQTPL